MKILLLGPPASGKGTLGDSLSELLGIPLITASAPLRALPPEHPRYAEIHDLMNKGEPAPKDFLGDLLRARIAEEDCKNGFILDGWCRMMVDLEYFDPQVDVVLEIKLSRESAIKRISGRRICEPTGEVYNIYTLPQEKLAECEGKLIQRADDKEEVVNNRYDQYITDTAKVVDHYRTKGILLEIDGEPSPAEVLQLAKEKLKL